MGIPLFFFLLLAGAVSAQQTDNTSQEPIQLESAPSATTQPYIAPRRPMFPVDTVNARPAAAPIKEEKPEKEAEKRFDIRERLFIGGSASLGFQRNRFYGNYFNLGGSPLIGYKITKYLAVGPGLIYQFYNMAGNNTHDFGGKGFVQVNIYKPILAHFEHSIVNTRDYQLDPQGRIAGQFRRQVSATLVGAGYRSMASPRFGMDLYVLLPVNYSTETYNTSYAPVIRAGIIYHLK